MIERTEEDIIMQRAFVVLGGERREFRVRSIREASAFRRAIGGVIGKALAQNPDVDIENISAIGATMIQRVIPILFSDGIDVLMEIPFLYAPELNQYQNESTEQEQIDAGMEVLTLAFPLVKAASAAAMQMVGLMGQAQA